MNETNYKILKEKNYDAVLELFFIFSGIKSLYLKLNPTMIHELEKNYPVALNKFTEHNRGFICDAIRSGIKKGIREAVYQSGFNIELRCTFFLKNLAIISDNEKFDFKGYNNDDLSEEIFGHLISGIATGTGAQLITRYKNKHKFRVLVTQLQHHLSDPIFG